MKPKIKICFSWRQIETNPAPIYFIATLGRWYSCPNQLFTDLKKLLY